MSTLHDLKKSRYFEICGVISNFRGIMYHLFSTDAIHVSRFFLVLVRIFREIIPKSVGEIT